MANGHLTIGEFAARSGVSVPTLRFYEERGLVHSTRTAGNQRRYLRAELRRVAFVRAAQHVGLTLGEIEQEMAALPDGRVPTRSDWARLSRSWRPRLDERIAELQRLRVPVVEELRPLQPGRPGRTGGEWRALHRERGSDPTAPVDSSP